MRRTSGADTGFTLVEMLVSLTILTLTLGAVVPVLLDGVWRVDASGRHATAAAIAQSLLDRFYTDPTFHGTEGLAEGGYSWTIANAAIGLRDDREAWAYAPQHVSVIVTWGARREQTVKLSSIKLARKER